MPSGMRRFAFCAQRFCESCSHPCRQQTCATALSTMPKRAGDTETFSISVDSETRKILKAEAERAFDGNVSRLISALAHESQRRAAIERLSTAPRMSDAEQAAFKRQASREIAVTQSPQPEREPELSGCSGRTGQTMPWPWTPLHAL